MCSVHVPCFVSITRRHTSKHTQANTHIHKQTHAHTEIEEERRPVAGTVGERENQREILQLVGFMRLLQDPAPQCSMLMCHGVNSRVSRLGAAGPRSPMFNVDVVAC